MGPPGAPFRLGPGAKCPSCPPPPPCGRPCKQISIEVIAQSYNIHKIYWYIKPVLMISLPDCFIRVDQLV